MELVDDGDDDGRLRSVAGTGFRAEGNRAPLSPLDRGVIMGRDSGLRLWARDVGSWRGMAMEVDVGTVRFALGMPREGGVSLHGVLWFREAVRPRVFLGERCRICRYDLPVQPVYMVGESIR